MGEGKGVGGMKSREKGEGMRKGKGGGVVGKTSGK